MLCGCDTCDEKSEPVIVVNDKGIMLAELKAEVAELADARVSKTCVQ